MTTPQEDFQKFLDEQRAVYRAALPGKIQEIQERWANVAATEDAAPPLEELCRLAHSLAGTAGTLGFREVGQAARALENLLDDTGENPLPLSPGLRSDIALALSVLQQSLNAQA